MHNINLNLWNLYLPTWKNQYCDISEECGALESVKAASELISPVSGKVTEKNEAVENKPSLINTSCYKEGWLFKVELNNLDEIKSLMNEETYNKFLKSDH